MSKKPPLFSLLRQKIRYAYDESSHRHLLVAATYVVLVLLIALLLVWRYPNNVTHANFYAEDGSVFLQNILDKGWLGALLTPFNGYAVWGMYLIEGLGWILNSAFGREGLLSLPTYFAISSILFMSAVIALPYVLFRRIFGKTKALLIVLLGALVPLPSSPHIVIGTVGNQKWVFMYLAFLLIVYRLKLYHTLSLWSLVAIDLSILISAYTNTTTYLLIPVIAIPYVVELWKSRHKRFKQSFLKIITRKDTISYVVLLLLLLPQIAYVALHGIPKLPGYLDSPYDIHRTIETFIHRTYLFGITNVINKYMNDVFAVGMFAIMVSAGWLALKKFERAVFYFGLYAAGVASALFVMNRPGVSDFFFGYFRFGSGPDQFFYAQTLIMYTPLVLLVFGLASKFKHSVLRRVFIGLFVLALVASALFSNNFLVSRWRNASVFENDGKTFIDQALQACKQKDDEISVVVYPYSNGQFRLKSNRSALCNANLTKYQSSITALGLTPGNNNYLLISRDSTVKQTFIATEPQLNGIQLFISTFGNERRTGTYLLTLYDETCKHQLRNVSIPTVILDNSYYNARFVPVPNSKAKTYCFGISAPQSGPYSPLAVQLSAQTSYQQGLLVVNGVPKQQDIVFAPLFRQTR